MEQESDCRWSIASSRCTTEKSKCSRRRVGARRSACCYLERTGSEHAMTIERRVLLAVGSHRVGELGFGGVSRRLREGARGDGARWSPARDAACLRRACLRLSVRRNRWRRGPPCPRRPTAEAPSVTPRRPPRRAAAPPDTEKPEPTPTARATRARTTARVARGVDASRRRSRQEDPRAATDGLAESRQRRLPEAVRRRARAVRRRPRASASRRARR